MRRTLAVLSLSVVFAVGLLIWALQSVTDPLHRPCGGGIFSSTAPSYGDDDSFKDVCDGIRDRRGQVFQALALPTGVVLLASAGWAIFLVTNSRHYRQEQQPPCGHPAHTGTPPRGTYREVLSGQPAFASILKARLAGTGQNVIPLASGVLVSNTSPRVTIRLTRRCESSSRWTTRVSVTTQWSTSWSA